MLERLNNLVGSTVLALVLVFGAAYLAFGSWTTESLRTAGNPETTIAR